MFPFLQLANSCFPICDLDLINRIIVQSDIFYIMICITGYIALLQCLEREEEGREGYREEKERERYSQLQVFSV
ncbi:hypothetical protein FKM82_027063 [Ascaphus truei]